MPTHADNDAARRVKAGLDRTSTYLLAAAIVFAVGVTIPRFLPGIPVGIDTTSHLYKILFLQYWWKQGVNPFWSADWYGGSPALLLYPPLSYYITAGIAMLGVDPLVAYKSVDAFFYWIAPLTIYLLARELGFGKGESALASLLYSAFPEVIENYLFFDRFPTTVAIPIFCMFLIFFHRSLTLSKSMINLLLSIFSMSALLLIHHLSALIAGMAAVLMIIVAFARFGVVRPLLKLIVAALGTFSITAFWLMPLLESYKLFAANAFYNRNVIFPFLRFTYFGFDVTSYLLGIAQFILAAVAVQSIVGRNFRARLPLRAATFFPALFAGMAIFQAGEFLSMGLLNYLGELIVALSFTVFFGQFVIIRSARSILSNRDGTIFAAFWFLLFLWLGLGYFANPLLQLPIMYSVWTKTMDVYRLWLYLALPMSALAARGFFRVAAKLIGWRPASVILLLILAITPITIGVAIKINYDLNSPINSAPGVLPYSTANTQIPSALIDYFKSDQSQGRILGINMPLWVYLLPIYIDKPIVDGWYPQTKLVVNLVRINDYRLDDLETAPTPAVRFGEWENLISSATLLDIEWVVIGDNGTLATALMHGREFVQQLAIPYGPVNLIVYKSIRPPSFIDGEVNVTDIASPNPDLIDITIHPVKAPTAILVKEAYFPTWRATANGNSIPVIDDRSTGYILLIVPAGTERITLYQHPDDTRWTVLSLIAVIISVGAAVGVAVRGKRAKR